MTTRRTPDTDPDPPRPGDEPEAGDTRERGALVFTRAAAREVDRLAADEFGMPSILLMENAAAQAADTALDMLAEGDGGPALIACGPGNNGGDGLAIARHLSNAGVETVVVLSSPRERYAGDAAINLGIAARMGLAIETVSEADPGGSFRAIVRRGAHPGIVIDALLGTGLDRPVREPIASMIEQVNALGAAGVPVLAVDIPSGLDADTGEPLGSAVRASTTVTFVGLKAGFLSLAAQDSVGEVIVAEIGVPRALVERLGRPLREALPHDEPPRPPRRTPPAARRGRG